MMGTAAAASLACSLYARSLYACSLSAASNFAVPSRHPPGLLRSWVLGAFECTALFRRPLLQTSAQCLLLLYLPLPLLSILYPQCPSHATYGLPFFDIPDIICISFICLYHLSPSIIMSSLARCDISSSLHIVSTLCVEDVAQCWSKFSAGAKH